MATTGDTDSPDGASDGGMCRRQVAINRCRCTSSPSRTGHRKPAYLGSNNQPLPFSETGIASICWSVRGKEAFGGQAAVVCRQAVSVWLQPLMLAACVGHTEPAPS